MASNANIKAVITAEDRASGTLKQFGNNVDKTGSRASRAMGNFTKVAIGAGIAVGALATKFILLPGIDRVLKIEEAQAKLKGLGHTTKSITKIMDSALKSVKGTAFGLDSAATAAASAVAAGVKPGKELTKYLTTVGDAATIAGVSFEEMGSIFGKVQTQQRAYTMEINQLADRGIPIYQWLQKELGVTQEALRDMVANGEIDSETYFKVIQKNIGGAALESGKTTIGAWKNMLAAMSRVGAAIVEQVIPHVREGFNSLTTWFDDNSDNIVLFFQNLSVKLQELGQKIGEYLGPKLEALKNTFMVLLPTLRELWQNVLQPLVAEFGTFLVAAIGFAIDALNLLLTALQPVLSWLARNAGMTQQLIKAIGLLWVAMKISAGITAFTGGMDIILNKLILARASLFATRQQVGLLRASLAKGMSLTILIGGALIALELVYQKFLDTKAAMEGEEAARRGANKSRESAIQGLNDIAKGRAPGNKAHAKKTLKAWGVPGYASGTSFFGGGQALVGERGPEMVSLPRGSKVHRNDETRKMMGGGTTINISIPMVTGGATERRKIARLLIRDLQDIASMNGRTVGEMLESNYGLVS